MARQRKLSPERKAFINGLIEHYQTQDAQDVQEMFKDTLQGMLEAEMDQSLGYSKYDYKNKETDNSRNGFSKKNSCFFYVRNKTDSFFDEIATRSSSG